MLKVSHVILAVVSVVLAMLLQSCGHGRATTPYARLWHTYNYKKEDVISLEKQLRNLKFPQKEGYVQSLLKVDNPVGLLVSVADLIPNDDGILASYTLTHVLNDEFILVIYQDHYADGKSPLDGDIVDSGAEVIRQKR